jgi:hypothetical protein
MPTIETPAAADKHLWEYDHPYYGPEDHTNRCESFAELRADIDGLDEDMNFIYRWDWKDWSQPHHDGLFVDGEDRSAQDFTVFLILPRKSMLICFTCPVTHDDEPAVLDWLRGARVAGALRSWWEPLLAAGN